MAANKQQPSAKAGKPVAQENARPAARQQPSNAQALQQPARIVTHKESDTSYGVYRITKVGQATDRSAARAKAQKIRQRGNRRGR